MTELLIKISLSNLAIAAWLAMIAYYLRGFNYLNDSLFYCSCYDMLIRVLVALCAISFLLFVVIIWIV